MSKYVELKRKIGYHAIVQLNANWRSTGELREVLNEGVVMYEGDRLCWIPYTSIACIDFFRKKDKKSEVSQEV